MVVHHLSKLGADPGNLLQLGQAGLGGLAGRAEVAHELAPPGLPHPGDAVEHAAGHGPVAQLAVVGDGEAVGLVADPLEEVQGLAGPGDDHRVGRARHVHLLHPLGQRHHGQVGAGRGPHRLQGGGQLGPAPVDHDQVGRVGELPPPPVLFLGEVPLGGQAGQAAGQDLAQGGHVVLALDRADLEAPVLALAGQAVLEHHHRAHHLAALEVGDVVALDPQRGLGQVEGLLELLEAPGPGVEVAGPLELVGGEGLAGVGRDRLQQGPLLPPAGHPEVDRPAAQPGQPGPQAVGALGQDGQEHLAGDLVGPVAVELLDEGGGQRGGVEGLDLVDHEAAPPHHPAPADEEHLDRRLQVVLGEGGDVEVLRGRGHHLLAFHGLADAAQLVAQPGRQLEVELLGGLAHLGLQPLQGRPGAPVHEGHEVLDDPPVLVGGDACRRTGPSTC